MTTDDLHPTHGNPVTLAHLSALVHAVRPDWPEYAVSSVLQAHASSVRLGDLCIAALRAAQDPTFRTPRTIGWRGPHWRGLETVPSDARPAERCDTCGKPEPRCLMERPGRDDDHPFTPRSHHGQ